MLLGVSLADLAPAIVRVETDAATGDVPNHRIGRRDFDIAVRAADFSVLRQCASPPAIRSASLQP